MATLTSTDLNLLDVAKRTAPDGTMADIVELLTETNEMLQDAPVKQCNNGTRNDTTIRDGEPPYEWKIINKGVGRGKSTTHQVVDTTARAEAFLRLDKAMPSKNKAALRMSENKAQLMSMNKGISGDLIYSNTNTDPEELLGFAPRYAKISGGTLKDQIISAGGSGSDNTSIYILGWNTDFGCCLLYPDSEGDGPGIEHEDLGTQLVTDANSKEYTAWVDHYIWNIGLCIQNPRAVVRICNIDVSDLTKDAATGTHLFNIITEAYWKIKRANIPGLKFKCYMNTTVLEYFDYQSRQHNANIQLTWREAGPDSQSVMHFRDMAFRQHDQILNSEATVS